MCGSIHSNPTHSVGFINTNEQIKLSTITKINKRKCNFIIFLVINRGKYKALVADKHIHTYNNSGSFGELALLYNMPR